jgi:hypothetical protein
MSVFTPEYKLSINGVEYTDVAISDIAHQAGREDIYAQPTPSYIQIALVALNNENYNFQVNDGIALQVKIAPMFLGLYLVATLQTSQPRLHQPAALPKPSLTQSLH